MNRPVVIIDDEITMRDELHYVLKIYHPDLEVIGSFDDPAPASPLIEAGNVEGVFLDINFEEKGKRLGLEFANRISRLPHAPWIIFITAYPENVFEAIPVRPFGFITKPIDHFMLETALDKVRRDITITPLISTTPVQKIEVHHKVAKLNDNSEEGLIKHEFITRFLAPAEIRYIQSIQGVNAVTAYLVNGEILNNVTLPLNQWLNFNLPCLIKIKNNTIVNLTHASGYKLDSSRFYQHLLTLIGTPTELPIGATFFDALKEALRKTVKHTVDKKLH